MTVKQNILVPFDGSANAGEALKQAIALAKALGGKVVLLNVQPSFQTAHTKIFFDPKDVHEYQMQLCHETADPAVKILKDSGVPFDVRMRVGNPKDVILQEAAQEGEEGTGLIVMGSRGLNPIVGAFLGSTSYGVLQETAIPVMIVPHKEPEEEATPQGTELP
jgi:nucleotide-binding universal stress UspA family protein